MITPHNVEIPDNVFPERFTLKGHVALVTGAGRGIGAAISSALAEAGADIVLVSRTIEEIEAKSQCIINKGRRSLPLVADICNEREVERVFLEIEKVFGKLDILVNVAGTAVQQKSEDMELVHWDEIMRLNSRALFHCCQMAARMMISRQSGKIINIASHLGVVALPLRAAYCTSKAAVIHLTRILGAEWAPQGINVNCIAPGYTMTQLAKKVLDRPEFKAEVISKTPAGFIAEPEDIAGAAVFLASTAARYMIGQTLVIDGGWSCV